MMRNTAVVSLLVFLFTPIGWAAVPDEVARQTALEKRWQPLSQDDANLIAKLVMREKYVVDARLSSSLAENGHRSTVLQKNKRVASIGPAQVWPETVILEEKTLPSGVTVRYLRAPTEAERVNWKLLHGTPAEQASAAFRVAGLSVAVFAGVLDEQIGGFSMLAGPNPSNQALIDATTTPGTCAAMAESMTQNDEEYTNEVVWGVDDTSGKFSMSQFLFGPACFFTMFGEYLAGIQDDADNACPSGSLECVLYNWGPDGPPDEPNVNYAGTFGRYEDPSAIISIPLDDTQAVAFRISGGGMPFSLLAGSAGALASAGVGAGSQMVLDDGSVVTFDRLERAIDLDAYVVTMDRICGNRESEGESQDFCIAREYSNFKTVPGTSLYEPYQETLRISGMFSDAERAEMAEAEEKLAEYEAQLASMPESQRTMMERMVGPQIAQYKNMVEGGRMSFHVVTTDIIVNPDYVNSGPSFVSAVEQVDEERMVRRIQQDLLTLGYEPGVLNGEVTPQTVTAIVRFEGDQGMKITGEPSQTLADALADAVSSRSMN